MNQNDTTTTTTNNNNNNDTKEYTCKHGRNFLPF
jgi:hypothetical protein